MASTTAPSNETPIVVMIAFPASGHTQGSIQMSDYLVEKGYTVYFIGGSEFKERIQRGGAECIEIDFNIMEAAAKADGLVGLDILISHLKHLFVDITPQAYRLLKTCLETVKERYPDREVVVWHECMGAGLLPMYYGAPLPKGYDKLPRVVNFQTSINVARSTDVFPFGLGHPPATNDQERAQCVATWDGFFAGLAPSVEYTNTVFKSLGATEEMTDVLLQRAISIGDVTVFPFSASLDFPRSDLDFNAQYVGTFARNPVSATQSYPSWWPEIEANSALPADSPDKKKLVFVSQGTVSFDYSELILPTIAALGARDDIITVAALGSKGAKLPDDFAVPANARVADYFPYELVLQHADVFVSNAGFGGYLHGVQSGVPMVVAGMGADKADVCARAEYVGIAVNLKTPRPTEEALSEAIKTILSEPKYKARVLELKKENDALDGLATAEKHILGTAD